MFLNKLTNYLKLYDLICNTRFIQINKCTKTEISSNKKKLTSFK